MRVEKEYFYTEDGAHLFGLLHTSETSKNDEVVVATHGMGSNCTRPSRRLPRSTPQR